MKSIYPWDKWFARKTKFKIAKGKDFNCPIYVMAQQIRNRACKEGISIAISVDNENQSLSVTPPKAMR